MKQNKSANIQVRITPELKAAIQERARVLLIKESDLIRFALAVAVQGKWLPEMLDQAKEYQRSCQE